MLIEDIKTLKELLYAAIVIIDEHVAVSALGYANDGKGRQWPVRDEYLHKMKRLVAVMDNKYGTAPSSMVDAGERTEAASRQVDSLSLGSTEPSTTLTVIKHRPGCDLKKPCICPAEPKLEVDHG